MIQEESFDAHSRVSHFGSKKLISMINENHNNLYKSQLHSSSSQDNRVFGKTAAHVQTDFIEDPVCPLSKEEKQMVPLK